MARRSLALTASELPLLRQKLQIVIEMIDLCLTDRQRPINGDAWHLCTHLPTSAIVHAVYDCAQCTTVKATITASNSNRRQPSLIGCFWPIVLKKSASLSTSDKYAPEIEICVLRKRFRTRISRGNVEKRCFHPSVFERFG